jgi:hypothetical protein
VAKNILRYGKFELEQIHQCVSAHEARATIEEWRPEKLPHGDTEK